jgi:polysaccharide export outer membrane protein
MPPITEWIHSLGEKWALSLMILVLLPYSVAAQSTTDPTRVDPMSPQQDQFNPNILNPLRPDQSSSGQDQLSSEEMLQLLQQQQPQGVKISNTHSTIEGRTDQNPPNSDTRNQAVRSRGHDDNEFQDFVTQSVGRRLPIFGQSLFEDVPSTFAPIDRVPVSANYVVGPGDELLIRAWGSIDIDYRVTVDRDGNIYVPHVGSINVAGLQFQQLQPYLKSAVGKIFRNFDLSVNLGQLRSIQIFVVGQAKYPGSYTVGSLSTLVNAIFASGGPLSTGSMRHIQLRRDGRTVTDFDLYDLISIGDKSKDSPLMPGDVIYFAPAGPLVALFGSVNTPAIYEIKDKTTLGEAIQYAGGLSTTASGEKAIIERIDEHKARSAADVSLDGKGLKEILNAGDIVRFIPVSPRFDKTITLRGNVALPGRYPWHEGMRISDLIPDRQSLIVRRYWENQNALIKDPFSIRGPRPAPQGGASQNGQDQTDTLPQDRSESQHVNQNRLGGEIKRNAPEVNWDYAVIQRLNLQDLTTRLIPFNLGKAISDPAGDSNIQLESGDIVTIFSQADLRVPLSKQSKFVRLEGEFQAAGIYRLEPGESLHHLITRVGGFTNGAYLYGAEFTRESTRVDQQTRLDQYTSELERSGERKSLAATNRAPSAEDAAILRAAGENQKRLLESLKQVKATGRIVLGLKPSSTAVDDLPDLALEDGDRLIVPFRPATVEVVGTVYNQGAFLYDRQKRARDYLRQAGGATKDADKSQIFIIRANGSVISNQRYSAFSGGIGTLPMMPGDTIFVPENFTRGSFVRNLKDIAQIAGQFGLAAAAINVLK